MRQISRRLLIGVAVALVSGMAHSQVLELSASDFGLLRTYPDAKATWRAVGHGAYDVTMRLGEYSDTTDQGRYAQGFVLMAAVSRMYGCPTYRLALKQGFEAAELRWNKNLPTNSIVPRMQVRFLKLPVSVGTTETDSEHITVLDFKSSTEFLRKLDDACDPKIIESHNKNS